MTLINRDFVVGFTPGAVWAGRQGGEWVQIGSGGLVRPNVQATTMIDRTDGRNKVWAVDGEGAILVQIDVEEGEVVGGEIEPLGAAVSNRGVGIFPAQTSLIATYRASIVVARQPLNSSIWYLSRSFNGLDWDYLADPLATTAVPGNNTDAGQVSDALTGLWPYGDDFLLMGASASIWRMTGDVRAGGSIDNVTYTTGILGPRAACFDEMGHLYFMGPGGLMRLPRGAFDPEPVAADRVRGVFERIDTEATLVQLAYDPVDHIVHIFLTAVDNSQSDHWLYDTRADAIWRERYPGVAGPHAVAAPADPRSDRRRPILGGSDGVARHFVEEEALAADDAGDDQEDPPGVVLEPYESFVRMAEIEAPNAEAELMIVELQASLASETGPVRWRIYTAESRPEVELLTPAEAADTGLWATSGGGGVMR